jgi:hypothetical protein
MSNSEERADELERYSCMHNDELSEANRILASAAHYPYCYSEDFNLAVNKEIKAALKDYKKHTKVETIRREHIVEVLVWDNEK